MPGRKFTQGASFYRYSINGQEKENEVNENITTAEYWEYDSRIGRRWNADPKPNPSISVYDAFADNPIWISDVLGDTTYHTTTSGKLIDIDNTGSGNWIAAGKYETSTFLVNVGTKKKPKYETRTVKLFDTQELYQVNDNELDAKQLSQMKAGDQVFTKINDENINWIMKDARVKHYSNAVSRWSAAAANSPYKQLWDFSYSYLLPALGLDPDQKIPLGDTKGGFIIFGKNANTAYNINDAGNWLWGQAMMRTGMDVENALIAANINSIRVGDGSDSPSDQFSIFSGYIYKVETSESVSNRIFLSPAVQKNANHPKQKGE